MKENFFGPVEIARQVMAGREVRRNPDSARFLIFLSDHIHLTRP
jgi:hypothetical protein